MLARPGRALGLAIGSIALCSCASVTKIPEKARQNAACMTSVIQARPEVSNIQTGAVLLFDKSAALIGFTFKSDGRAYDVQYGVTGGHFP